MRRNIAFKCVYNDGGEDKNKYGYRCVCSDEIIRYNIEKRKAAWCSNKNCHCYMYYSGKSKLNRNSNHCGESSLLVDWDSFAGISNFGTDNEKSRPIRNAQQGKIALLTTVLPDKKEAERIIFSIFRIGEIFQYDREFGQGHIVADKKYRIELNKSEKIYFCDYHRNKNRENEFRWNQGLFRYIYDDDIVKLLSDLIKIKQGKEDEDLSKQLYNKFIADVNTSF